ncbi:hypothetical protein [Vibrio sp. R78045]|uniref:hypothetical protein n=1 Tax=Vibrio sp. R78045 TaxID=3093868 RepID=UPI0036F2B5BA
MRKITLVSTILASMLTLNPSAFAGAQDQSDENSSTSQNTNFQQKKPANKNNHGGMNSHKDKVTPVTVRAVPNDDVVGSRSGSNPTYNKPKNSAPKQANTTINCNHPAYKTLCAELKKAAEPAPTPKPPAIVYPKKNVWITVADRTNTNARDLAFVLPISLSKMRPKYVRLNNTNTYKYSYNGNTLTIRHSKKVPDFYNASERCSAKNGAVSACSAKISSNIAYGCNGNTVDRYTSKRQSSGNGSGCFTHRGTYTLMWRVSKVQVMY